MTWALLLTSRTREAGPGSLCIWETITADSGCRRGGFFPACSGLSPAPPQHEQRPSDRHCPYLLPFSSLEICFHQLPARITLRKCHFQQARDFWEITSFSGGSTAALIFVKDTENKKPPQQSVRSHTHKLGK